MIEKKFLIILKIICILENAFSVRLHTEFGDYNHKTKKELWNPDCGLTNVPKIKESSDFDKCFKWKTPFRHLMSLIDETETDTKETDINSRIMNGEIAKEGDAPWVALLGNGCGGVILNKKWVLTAAHCLTPSSPFTIRVGSNDQRKQKKYFVEDVFVVTEKLSIYELCLQDIGLLKMKEEINFNIVNNTYMVNSVCLPKKGERNVITEFATLFGWGHLSNKDKRSPNLLRKAKLLLRKSSQCKCYCNEPSAGLPYPCKGDSGNGLIQYIGPRKRAVVIGIASASREQTVKGFELCTDLYTEFAVVPHHIDWLLNTMKVN